MTGVQTLNIMIIRYVSESRRTGRSDTIRTAHLNGMADMITHVAGVLYGEGDETATERVGDMITDVMCNND